MLCADCGRWFEPERFGDVVCGECLTRDLDDVDLDELFVDIGGEG
jgi:hypothetical protein